MASTISTGGAGTHFESRVAAYFIATVLCQTAARGLPQGMVAAKVEFQRGFEGDSSALDDVILEGVSGATESRLSLQVKRELTFGDNDLFKEVMSDCWKTFSSPDFKKNIDRFGVAIGKIAQAVEKGGRDVLDLARKKSDAIDFLNHLQKQGVASDSMRTFSGNIRDRLNESKGSPVSDTELWEFLRHFEVLYFDFEQGESSESLTSAINGLAPALIPVDSDKTPVLWGALIGIADEYKPAAGSLTRSRLIEILHNRFRLSGLNYSVDDVNKIQTSSQRVLNSIKSQLGTVHLDRIDSLSELISRSAECEFIEITGEPGSGKSALLKAFAEIKAQDFPILVVDTKRLPETPGLESLERLWGISCELDRLIPDFSRAERPCLFIDGIDRIEEAGYWATINDLIRCIRKADSGERWCIIVTARANTLDYRQNIAKEALGKKQGRINVDVLSDEEVKQVAATYPALSALIKDDGPAGDLAKRPYLLDRLIKSKFLDSDSPPSKITEIDLMLDLWTDDGGKGQAFRIQRQSVLTKIGKALLAGEGLPKSFDIVETDALQSLSQDDIIRNDLISGKLEFCHDILEDWVLCRCLDDDSLDIATLLDSLDQALWLVEAIQLLAQYYLEKKPDTTNWQKLLQTVGHSSLDPRWKRAVVTAPLQSPSAYELLIKIEAILLADDAKLLHEMMVSLRTIEILPNTAWYNPEIKMDGLDDPMRKELAFSTAHPRARAWRPFLGWLRHRINQIPPHLVSELSKVLDVLPKSMGAVPDFLSDIVVDWARGWLQIVDYPWHRDTGIREKYSSLQLGRHEDDKLGDRLRHLILSSAEGAGKKVAEYLLEVQEGDRHRGAEYIIENSNLLASHMPTELADFMLRVMCSEEDAEERRRHSGRGPMAFQRLEIYDDRLFFPACHLRPPFLSLLQNSPVEGLRLINGFCNYAIEMWREILRDKNRGTPLPVHMSFSWGEKDFWGHEQQYLWFRALGVGPYSVCSALMALEVWMEAEVKRGRDLNDLFEAILKENNCVGVLGVCVSIILANPEKSLDIAIPFATNPFLWDWDLRRTVHERPGPSNLIGFMPKDFAFFEHVRARNNLPHRKTMLREIVPYYILTAGAETKTAFINCMKKTVEGELPYQYEEWRGHPDAEAELKDQIRRMEAMADPQNYKIYDAEDGKNFIFQYEHPADLAPEAEQIQTEQAELGKYLQIALWVEQCLETGNLLQEVDLQEAVAKAKEWDEPELFSIPLSFEDMKRQKRAAAVAGTVAVLLSHEAQISQKDMEWCRNVLSRAASTPFEDDTLTIRMSIISFHPAQYAVRGLMALIRTGKAHQEDKHLALALVCHPLEMIAQTVYLEVAKCWDSDPVFCWQAFVLATKLSLMPRSIMPRGHGLEVNEPEQQFLESAFNKVVTDYDEDRLSELPSIPLEWTEDPTLEPDHRYGQYRRSEILFMWHTPPKSLFLQPVSKLLADGKRRKAILKLLQEFMAWTEQDCCPPWNTDKGSSSSSAFEWQHAFMAWCAELSLHLTAEETNTLIIDPILSMEGRRVDYLLSDFIREFLDRHFSQNAVPDDRTIALWKRLCEVVFAHRDVRFIQNTDTLTRDFGESVGYTLFCYPVRCRFQHPWAPVHTFDAEIKKWVETFGKSKACFGILISFLQSAGWAYAPSQAIEWLSNIAEAHKDNSSFWTANSNGSEATSFLEKLIDSYGTEFQKEPDIARKIIRVADILTASGISTATQIQQRMAKIMGRIPKKKKT